MKKYKLFIPVLILSTMGITQDFENLDFGTESTFEIMTWNIEWFPKNDQITVDYVKQIIEALDIDLLAIQEVDDTDFFDQMLDGLPGYEGYYESSWFAGLAYIYKTDVIEINEIYEIYTTSPYWSPFPRSPMVMDMNFRGENFIIINNHFKCCGDGYLDLEDSGDEEMRRYIASNLLKEYIDTNFIDENVIVLGDLNDILTDNPNHNVFQNFINDAENYLFADMEIAEGSSSGWSYPTWPSHIDHILITNELFDEFENTNSEVQTIKIDEHLDGGWYEYDQNVSDHRPVALKLDFGEVLSVDYTEGWNLVGLPLIVEDNDYQMLFPDAVNGTLYSFNGSYHSEEFIEMGTGYWLRFQDSGSAVMTGTPVSELSLSVNTGWNLISSISIPVEIGAIIDPDNIIINGTIYGFDSGYVAVDELVPGEGYWVRTNNSGSIILVGD